MQRGGRPLELPQGLLLHLVLDAASAEGADLSAGRVDDHDRPGLLRRRAPRLDDLAEDQRTVLLEGLDQLPDDVAHAFTPAPTRSLTSAHDVKTTRP